MPHHQPAFNSAVSTSPSGISLVRNANLTLNVVEVTLAPLASLGRMTANRTDARGRRLATMRNSACATATGESPRVACFEGVVQWHCRPDPHTSSQCSCNAALAEMTFTNNSYVAPGAFAALESFTRAKRHGLRPTFTHRERARAWPSRVLGVRDAIQPRHGTSGCGLVRGDDARSYASPDSGCASNSLSAVSEFYSFDHPSRPFRFVRSPPLAIG